MEFKKKRFSIFACGSDLHFIKSNQWSVLECCSWLVFLYFYALDVGILDNIIRHFSKLH